MYTLVVLKGHLLLAVVLVWTYLSKKGIELDHIQKTLKMIAAYKTKDKISDLSITA
jgi:hypothetical protein